jgi:hypothetical protein
MITKRRKRDPWMNIIRYVSFRVTHIIIALKYNFNVQSSKPVCRFLQRRQYSEYFHGEEK